MPNKGIPTMYDTQMFRSRLEAKWACMFDLLGWKWQYEPTDFNGWIPDFVLYGVKQRIYVEVKPVVTFPKDVADKIDIAMPGNPDLSFDYTSDEVIILGETCPLPPAETTWMPTLGWLREGTWWEHAVLFKERTSHRFGFCHQYGSYRDRITGEYDGDHHIVPVDDNDIIPLWRQACNVTQWRHK